MVNKIFNGKAYTCKKIKESKAYRCAPKHKKVGKKGGSGKLKRTRGARMRMAKKRAAKMPGGRGPVKKRPAGRKIMKH